MEKELFPAVKALFEETGYRGDGEVGGIDLVLEKNDVRIAVELKESLNFRVVQQAALRQKIADFVYIAVPRPRDLYSRSGKDKQYLLKRLGIGLIVVSKRTGRAEVVLDPVPGELSAFQARNKAQRDALAEELRQRRLKTNTGGVNKTKLLTAYREEALLVLHALAELGGEAATAEIRNASGVARATNILYLNHYGWFSHTAKGRYAVSSVGTAALTEYAEVIRALTDTPSQNSESTK
ncbi:MAG: DUF2161 family putative PD-(D/E)XK-type phosphodiesterase [Clostridia bacterium]|nr:DUF2161 family putative PD-(D/E)XK-type phosphodiesterase [Clostridia bacterium]